MFSRLKKKQRSEPEPTERLQLPNVDARTAQMLREARTRGLPEQSEANPVEQDLRHRLWRALESRAKQFGRHVQSALAVIKAAIADPSMFAAYSRPADEFVFYEIDPAVQRTLVLHHDTAPGVRCLSLAAQTLWCLGYPAQALRRSQEAQALAHALDHPQSLSSARHYAAFLHQRRRETPVVQVQADTLLSLATAQGFPFHVGLGTCWRGWALGVARAISTPGLATGSPARRNCSSSAPTAGASGACSSCGRLRS